VFGKRCREGGYVFIDVLLFTVILLVGVTAAYGLLTQGLSHAVRTQEHAVQEIELRNEMETGIFAEPLPSQE